MSQFMINFIHQHQW